MDTLLLQRAIFRYFEEEPKIFLGIKIRRGIQGYPLPKGFF